MVHATGIEPVCPEGRLFYRQLGSANSPIACMVPEEGVEPSRLSQHWVLSPACLPFHHSGAKILRATLSSGPLDTVKTGNTVTERQSHPKGRSRDNSAMTSRVARIATRWMINGSCQFSSIIYRKPACLHNYFSLSILTKPSPWH